MITNRQWERYIYSVALQGAKNGKKVKSLDYELRAEDILGTFNVTDLQIQEGKKPSGTIPHTSDMLSKLHFGIDERSFMDTVSNPVKIGVQPTQHTNATNRIFNIVNRGHSVAIIPNVFHEDYTKKIVTTALDLTLYPKEDYDLVRISTNDGAFIPGRYYSNVPSLANHPLNTMYTQEFFFSWGLASDKIELKTSIRSARITRGSDFWDMPLQSHVINAGYTNFQINRQRLMIAPAGSFRIRIEFYKGVTDGTVDDQGKPVTYLKDVGIGYSGLAELTQWTYGGSKL